MRTTKCINNDWMFSKMTDDTFIQVNIPHTWNNKDGQDGGNDYYRGACKYQKRLEKIDIPTGGRVYLEFRGVNSSAEIIVNKIICGIHDGGYSTFRVDITNALQDENLIEVVVDNSPNNKVYPQRADFTFYGGIYRDVYLIIVPESHFDLGYYGSDGIKVTPKIDGNNADVNITVYTEGNYDKIRYTIEGVGRMVSDTIVSQSMAGDTLVSNSKANDMLVVQLIEAESLMPKTTDISKNETILTIENVHLWNGLLDPYLYEVKAEMICNDEVVDTISKRFGCRTYSFDKDKGFFLNGKSYPLHGVSRHQDRIDVGNALTKDMHEEDIELILEMGANSIRLAHYQHDQYVFDLCDEKGIIVWAEIPYISSHMPEARENTISQMTELIVQNYNHPSIICWALSNEISLTGVTEDLIENHKILNELAHNMDKTRVTAMANLFLLETDSPLIDIPDIMSYNLYYGWYVGDLEENDKFFDDFHAKYPEKIIGLSEYGADTVVNYQSAEPRKGDYTEQYQCLYHEHILEMISKRPYLWSTYLWNMFEFAADGRDEAGDPGKNHKGVVTFDRKTKKDAFYIYKAWWSKEPFVHICGSRYVDRVEAVTEIKVYSNQDKVSLYVDDKLIEEKQGKHIFTFKVNISSNHKIEAKAVVSQNVMNCDTNVSLVIITDSINIKKVDTPNTAYLMEGVSVKNWFDEPGMEIIPGYLSIKDKIADIKKSPEGKALYDNMMMQMMASMGDVAASAQLNEGMVQMIERQTLETMLKQAGRGIKKEMVVSINRQLSKIKKA